MARNFSTGSRRDDATNKPPLSKLMWKALREVAFVHAYGDKHYGQGNWRKGQPYSEASNSLLRHWDAMFNEGEDIDPASKRYHAAHMAWNALFILHMQLHPDYYAECDDRMDAFGDWVNEEFAQTSLAKELEKGDDS